MCLRLLTPKRRPEASMFQACMLSSALSSAVLSPAVAGARLEAEAGRAERRHLRLFLPLAMAIGALSAVVLWQIEPALISLSPFLVLTVLRLDSSHYRLRRERSWFLARGSERL
jgi:hypothetical protein